LFDKLDRLGKSISQFPLTLIALIVLMKALVSPNFEQQLSDVRARSAFYTTATQSKAIREKRLEDVLACICPNRTGFITPKLRDEVAGAKVRRIVD
jgi:hypothetical protein